MKVVPNIPLIWAKKIRDAGMTKNQAQKILDESKRNADVAQNAVKSGSGQEKSNAQKAAEQKLNVL